uniref:Uncharacterized protein n=1 Tax=Oreochromis aureus TaxID=47969 RepID=A0A668SI58_OREAU
GSSDPHLLCLFPGVKTLKEMALSAARNQQFTLKNPPGAILRIVGLEDTMYRGKLDEVNGWGRFYLPEIVNMQVFGVVEGTSCPCDELVLMNHDGKKIYAYDGEKLHLVASSLQELLDKGIEYPASESYSKREPLVRKCVKSYAFFPTLTEMKNNNNELSLILLFCNLLNFL